MAQEAMLHSIQEQLGQVEEGDVYSKDVRKAIEIVGQSTTIGEMHARILEHPGLDIYNLIHRRADNERRELGNVMSRLQGLKNLPSLDVDFI